jgi:hypothetical protein
MRVLYLLLFLGITCVNGQVMVAKQLPIFKEFFQRKEMALSYELGNTPRFIDTKNYRFNHYPQYLLKNNDGLFCLIEATGQVYKLNEYKKDSIQIIRLDSTHFYGYNNRAILFSYRDTIFSFGGNGFWKYNGHLRYFNKEKAEWNIIQLNDERHGLNNIFQFDSKNGILYFVSNPYRDPGTGKDILGNEVIKLELKTRKMQSIGRLNNKIAELFVNSYSPLKSLLIPIQSLKSVFLVFDINNMYLLNFQENSLKKLKNEKLNSIFWGSSNMIHPSTLFEEGGKLFYTKSKDTTFQLFQESIKHTDFDSVSEKLYSNNKISVNEFIRYSILLLVCLLFLMGYGYYYFFIQHRNNKASTNKIEPLFSPLEIELLKQILNKSTKGDKGGCSSDDINNVLGLKKKSLEIQKKARTEAIGRINQKFKSQFATQEELIIRIRTEEDRRFYRYTVNADNVSKVINSSI